MNTIQNTTESIQLQPWPKLSKPIEADTLAAAEYARGLTKKIRDAEIAISKKKKPSGKKGAGAGTIAEDYDEKKPKDLRIFIAKDYPKWKLQTIEAVKAHFNASTGAVDDVKVRQALQEEGLLKDKKVMPFVMLLKVSLFVFPAFLASTDIRREFLVTHCAKRTRDRIQQPAVIRRDKDSARHQGLPRLDDGFPKRLCRVCRGVHGQSR